MNPRVIEDMPEAEYFADERMSKSKLWPFKVSTKNGAFHMENPFEGNNATVLGSAFHRLVEDGGFENIVEHTETKTTATKAFKAEVEANPGKTVMLASDAARLRSMWDSAQSHPRVSKVFSESSKAELVLMWDDDILKLPMKCRIDRVFPGVGGVDVKTVRECSVRAIESNINDFGYHAQAALYCRAMQVCMGIETPAWLFSWHETSKPYDCVVAGMPREDIEQGWAELEICAGRYRQWRKTGECPGISEAPMTLGLPRHGQIEGLRPVNNPFN